MLHRWMPATPRASRVLSSRWPQSHTRLQQATPSAVEFGDKLRGDNIIDHARPNLLVVRREAPYTAGLVKHLRFIASPTLPPLRSVSIPDSVERAVILLLLLLHHPRADLTHRLLDRCSSVRCEIPRRS